MDIIDTSSDSIIDTSSDHTERFLSSSHGRKAAGIRFFLDEDEESYIEINLEAMQESEEFEFEFSFSSLPVCESSSSQSPMDKPLEDISCRILPLGNFDITKIQLLPASNSETAVSPADASELPSENSMGVLGAGHRSNIGMAKDHGSNDVESLKLVGKLKDQEVMETRKPSKITMVLNSGVMKFLIKLPSDKIRSTFLSVMKSSYHSFSSQSKGRRDDTTRETIQSRRRSPMLLPLHKWIPQRKIKNNNTSKRVNTTNNQHRDRFTKRSWGSEINGDALRDAFGLASSSLGTKNLELKSFPAASIVSSSQHRVIERDSSISSAIAHCKMSFGNVTITQRR